MRTASLLAASALVAAAIVVHGATRKVDFSGDTVGQPPKGFEFGHTAKTGAPGKWVVQAEGANKVLARQIRTPHGHGSLSLFSLTLAQLMSIFLCGSKPVSGRVDQAAGLVWRFQNEDNYYIVRANALENNVVLYKVEKGKRTDLPLKGEGRTYGKKAPGDLRPMEHAERDCSRGQFRRLSEWSEAVQGRGLRRSRNRAKSASGRRQTP